ncbi:hypothetical protein LY78DRAFT_657786 [Colletotrichum sublineola]|nr:hypothetical protein LY78DRAFT_657786 [Colletotrichum sublineola]
MSARRNIRVFSSFDYVFASPETMPPRYLKSHMLCSQADRQTPISQTPDAKRQTPDANADASSQSQFQKPTPTPTAPDKGIDELVWREDCKSSCWAWPPS